MNLQFQSTWLLYWIWIPPVLAALWMMLQRRALRALNSFVSPVMQPKLLPRHNPARQYWQTVLVSLGALLLIIAAAGPRWGERDETILQQSRDLIVAIDVSQSMLANDIHPSRLLRAKVDAMDLIASLNGDRAALIAFRAKPVLVCPLTTDYAFLRQALAGITPETAPRGETDIGAAISRALDAFSETEASHKAVILISDGEDLSGLALEMAENAGKRGIPIYTVGLGSRTGSTIPDPQNKNDVIRFEGKPVITKLDHDSLYTIAQKSGGSYIPIETAGTTDTTLGTIYSDHLRNVTRRELAESRRRRAVERFQWFLLPGFILLAAACALSRGRLATGPQRNTVAASRQPLKTVSLLALFLLPVIAGAATNAPATDVSVSNAASPVIESPPPPTNAPTAKITLSGHAAAREAWKLYKKGDYENAVSLFRAAEQDSPPDVERKYRYNEGASLAAAGKHDEAAGIFRSLSLQSRRGGPDAAEALGITLYRASEAAEATSAQGAEAKADSLQQAAEAFKEAWRNTPATDDARHNLALMLKQLPPAQENALALRLAEKYGQTPAPALAAEMLKTQRDIAAAIPQAATSSVPVRIAELEALAQRQKENAECWMPLKQKLAEALAQQPAQDDKAKQAVNSLYSLMDVTRDTMNDSYRQLRDIQSDSFRPAKMSEQGMYQLWKGVASHEMLLAEGITQQTNAINQVVGNQPPDPVQTTSELQLESAALTDLFRSRFEQAVPPEGTVQPAPEGGTNTQNAAEAKPEGITPEVRQQILQLATETAAIQRDASENITNNKLDEALAGQQTARDKLLEIAELLPKPPPQQQPQDQPKEPPPPQQKPQQPPQDQPQDQPKEKQPEEQPQPSPKKEDDVQKLLKRALEREREFENEKRERQNRIPLPPSARDW